MKIIDECLNNHLCCEHVNPGQRRSTFVAGTSPLFSCAYDSIFYQCLRDLKTPASNFMGDFYFTHQEKCFIKSKQIGPCRHYKMKQFGGHQIRRCAVNRCFVATRLEERLLENPLYSKDEIFDIE